MPTRRPSETATDARCTAPQPLSRPQEPRGCPVAPDGHCRFGTPTPHVDRSSLLGPVSVVRCQHCGVGISLPAISDLASLYADRTSQDFQQSNSRLTRAIKSVAFRRQARGLLAQVRIAPTRVIDFGCGSGLFTRQLGELLPASEVIGTDFHRTAPAELGENPYRPFDSTTDLAGSADLVLAMHVLEHDEDSMALLLRIARLAKPGGRVVIEVPNVDCAWTRVFGRFWDAWYLPYHRVHFNRTSLRGLIRQSGLALDREIAVCVPTMGRTVANVLGRRNSLAFILVGIVLHPVQWLLERATRKPSALRIVARVPGP